MKKLVLDVESLAVETFEVANTPGAGRGTVKGAQIGTFVLSDCASACMQSGHRPCLATETCC